MYKPNVKVTIEDETPFDTKFDEMKVISTDVPPTEEYMKNNSHNPILVDYHKRAEEKYRNSFKFNFTRPDKSKSNSNKFTDSESTKDIFQELIDKNTKNQK